MKQHLTAVKTTWGGQEGVTDGSDCASQSVVLLRSKSSKNVIEKLKHNCVKKNFIKCPDYGLK